MPASEMLSALREKSAARLTSAQEEVTAFDEYAAAELAEVAAKESAAYDEGYKKGEEVSGTPGGEFTLEELNAEIEKAVAPLNDQIADLNVKAADLQAKLDAMPSAESAVAAFKADLIAKYEAQQVAESDSETGFKDLLK